MAKIDEDKFYDFCKENKATDEFISQLHFWLDKFEFEGLQEDY